MASRAVHYWRSMTSRMPPAIRRGLATSTAARMKPFATAPSDFIEHKARAIKGEFAPVYVVLGMILVSLTMGFHTAKQQLVNSPNVSVRKKKRETVWEVEEPDYIAGKSDKFINKSVFRRMAHIQDFDRDRSGITDPSRLDPFNNDHRRLETLKSVGVNPRRH